MSPLPQRTSDGARLRLVPAVIRQYSKLIPRFTSSRRSASVSSRLVAPGACLVITASIDCTTRSEASRSMASSSGRLRARSRSSITTASFTFDSGKAPRSDRAASAGRNGISTPMLRVAIPARRR